MLTTLTAFYFNDTTYSEIYTLSLPDALPISSRSVCSCAPTLTRTKPWRVNLSALAVRDRKSTRLNSSHLGISYAVFCLKKKQRDVLCPAMQPRHLPDARLRCSGV